MSPIETMQNHPKLPEKDLIRILREKEDIEITEGEDIKLGEWDFSDLPGLEDRDFDPLKHFAEVCQLYLSGSIFRAASTDEELSKWRKQMSVKYGAAFQDFFIKNKMSGGRLAVFQLDFGDVIRELDRKRVHTDKANQIRGLYESWPDLTSFRSIGWEGRLKFVRQVENIARTYITLVAKQP